MKKTYSRFLIFSFLLVWLAIPPLFTGCESASRNAYTASQVTHSGVVAALKTWNEYLGQKDVQITAMAKTDPDKARVERARIAEQNAKIEASYKQYQASQLVILAASQALAALPPGDPAIPSATDRLSTATFDSSARIASVHDLVVGYTGGK